MAKQGKDIRNDPNQINFAMQAAGCVVDALESVVDVRLTKEQSAMRAAQVLVLGPRPKHVDDFRDVAKFIQRVAKQADTPAGRVLQRMNFSGKSLMAEEIRLLNGDGKRIIVMEPDGSENSLHHQIGYFLGAKTYFCHPYHSWEKGTNENTNGLVRRYLPHHRNINDLTQAELDLVARALNHRPRKKLGFYTPVEMLKLAGYKLISCNQI